MTTATLSATDEFVSLGVEYGASGGDVRSFTAKIERFALELGDFGKYVFPRVIEVLEGRIAEQFDSAGMSGQSGAWAELSPAYAAWKARAFPGGSINIRTSSLVAAMTSSAAPTALRKMSKTALEFGSRGVDYASFVNFGTRNMPARAFLDFGSEIVPELEGALRAGLAAAARAGQADEFFEGAR